MNKQQKNIPDRREWFKSLARLGALAGLSVVGFLTAAPKSSSLSEDKCTNRYLCRHCTILQKCRLPRALSLKQILAKK